MGAWNTAGSRGPRAATAPRNRRATAARIAGEGPQQIQFAVEQIRQRLRTQRPGRKIRQAAPGVGNAARARRARIAGASLGAAHARLAREAKRDQAQIVEIPGSEAWDTGDRTTTQADRWRLPASARLQGKRAKNMGSRYVLDKATARAPGPDPNRVGAPAGGV
jgi:hypothetical protein